MREVLSSMTMVVLPLFLGYLCNIRNTNLKKWLDKSLLFILYALLFCVGINIARIDNLHTQIWEILLYGSSFLILNFTFNILGTYLFDRYRRMQNLTNNSAKSTTNIKQSMKALLFSAKQLLWIFAGFLTAWVLLTEKQLNINIIISILLIVMLFLVGLLLRNQGFRLLDIFVNRVALYLTIIFVTGCWSVAVIISSIYDIPLQKALAINSGFGWYSLSVAYFNQTYGPFWGAIAVINDLGREIMAFILIPVVMQFSPNSGITISGATALDFTLSAIKQMGGNEIVPIAVSFGFITSILCPLAMTFFSHI